MLNEIGTRTSGKPKILKRKGGDKICVNQEESLEQQNLGDLFVGVDAVHSSDVSSPQRKKRKCWKNTKTK